ncbi:hypothetical protein WB334_25565, partial [Escherichia coli]|nr:hypothetical protein [Escherichia coli]
MATDIFKARLAQLDALLQPGSKRDYERLEYERNELALRLNAARLIGMTSLLPELEREVAAREEALADLSAYLKRPLTAAPLPAAISVPAAPIAQPAPILSPLQPSAPSQVPSARPVVSRVSMVPPTPVFAAEPESPAPEFVEAVAAI